MQLYAFSQLMTAIPDGSTSWQAGYTAGIKSGDIDCPRDIENPADYHAGFREGHVAMCKIRHERAKAFTTSIK